MEGGEWEAEGPIQRSVCHVSKHRWSDEEVARNTALIAAAPKMASDLAEVQRLLKEAYYHLHTLRLIEEADPRMPKSEGLEETYHAIKSLLAL